MTNEIRTSLDQIISLPRTGVIETPPGLKPGIALKQHQKEGLFWMASMENCQLLRGGILADEMGLGKTSSVISLVVYDNNRRENERAQAPNDNTNNATLIVAPLTLLANWEQEIDKFVLSNRLTVQKYHGPNRRLLDRSDIILTTYGIAATDPAIANVNWWRIVLDEGHVIRNFNTEKSRGICALRGVNRWVVTGTPIHNGYGDMYAYIKFLEFAPLNDTATWNTFTDDNRNVEHLRLIVRCFCLRRRKDGIVNLPQRNVEKVHLEMLNAERAEYDEMFEEYQQQRANNARNTLGTITRLRRACAHTSLVSNGAALLAPGAPLPEPDGNDDVDALAQQLGELAIDVFTKQYRNAKLVYILNLLASIPENDNVVLVSQWTDTLEVIGHHLDQNNITHTTVSGKILPEERSRRVELFNGPEGPRVMLLSLTAGGVGLNLTRANHLVLFDPHWNPALELQACDRIHRFGQEKDVHIYELIYKNTYEENEVMTKQNLKLNKYRLIDS